MLRDAVADLPREIQALAVVFQPVDDPQALLVVIEAARSQIVEDALAGVTKRRVAEIVTERDRLGQLLVQTEDLRDRPRDLRDLQRVREPRAVVVALRRQKDLRLVRQASKRLGVDDAVAIALERSPQVIRTLVLGAAPRSEERRVGKECRL